MCLEALFLRKTTHEYPKKLQSIFNIDIIFKDMLKVLYIYDSCIQEGLV